ncbi:MAG: hypothetical protein JNM46_00295 [Anaerolineales bacterium]|nr:hypothetical protein [Anaerolineales bacterium]
MIRKLTREERTVLAEKLMDWGNHVFIGLVIAQFVPGASPFRFHFLVMGIVGMLMGYISGLMLMKTKGGDQI